MFPSDINDFQALDLLSWFRRSLLILFLLDLGIFVVIILSRVRDLVFEDLDELVEHNSKDSADGRTGPVDPVLFIEYTSDDAWSETARGIERATGVVHANEFGNEERKADTNGCDKRCCKMLVSIFL
jgi:hypothetical protein